MSADKKTSINPMPNGPYIVRNINKLSNVKGEIEAGETVVLCRCGASANKPFCDGSHTKIDFNSDKHDDRVEDKKESYIGNDITIIDNRSVCAHAGVCTDNLPDVFRMKQESWINPDAKKIEEIISIINKCPSGALSYSVKNTDEKTTSSDSAVVELTDITWGSGASEQQFTLCRCGASKNKPFCDGSHWSINFTDNKN